MRNHRDRRSNYIILFTALSLFTFCACGGGGGSGGGANPRSARTGLRILHGAIDAFPVDAASDSTGLVQTARFGESTVYSRLALGPQNISLTRTLTPSVKLFGSSLNVELQNRYSLLLYGNQERLGLRTAIFLDGPPDPAPGTSALRIVHAVSSNERIDASSDLGEVQSGIDLGTASAYIPIGSGTRAVTIKRAANKQTILRKDVTLEPKRAYTLLVTGEINYFVHAVLLED